MHEHSRYYSCHSDECIHQLIAGVNIVESTVYSSCFIYQTKWQAHKKQKRIAKEGIREKSFDPNKQYGR